MKPPILAQNAFRAIAVQLILLAIGPVWVQAAPKPPPPRSVFAVRVGPGVIGVEWPAARWSKVTGYRVFRSEKREAVYRPIADRGADQTFCLDTNVKPSKVYFYKVTTLGPRNAESAPVGPACAWDDDQVLPHGSFELDPLGPVTGLPAGWGRRAYNRRTPVRIINGGPDGERCVEIRSSNSSVSGGLHSVFIPAVEGETFDQFTWARSLPGASPLVGRCFYTAERRTVKFGKKPYDYTAAGKPRPDGWALHAGAFTVPPTGAYCVLWLIGFQARNTLWFDGAQLIDHTSRRVREFPYEAMLAEGGRLMQASATGRSRRAEIEKIEHEMATVRQQMTEGLPTLTPLAYRRLLVALDRAQRGYSDLLWRIKTLGLLLD